MNAPTTYATVRELLDTGVRPEGVRVITTYACSRGCKFCYQTQRHSVKLDSVKFVQHCRDMQDIGLMPIYFTFQGGEVSTHPNHTYAMCRVADKYFPQVFRKSITSNGYGERDFYHAVKLHGITHITLSLHGPNKRVETLAQDLAQDGFYTVRINCFLHQDHLDAARYVYCFCRDNRIQLTLCEDLRPDCIKPPSPKQISEDVLKLESPHYVMRRYKHQDVWTNPVTHYRFWVYHHIDHYDYNNIIVLPDGSLTMTFDDVMVCAGSGENDAS